MGGGNCYGCPNPECEFACYDYCTEHGGSASCYGKKCCQLECVKDMYDDNHKQELAGHDDANPILAANETVTGGNCWGCPNVECEFACLDYCTGPEGYHAGSTCYGEDCGDLECRKGGSCSGCPDPT